MFGHYGSSIWKNYEIKSRYQTDFFQDAYLCTALLVLGTDIYFMVMADFHIQTQNEYYF